MRIKSIFTIVLLTFLFGTQFNVLADEVIEEIAVLVEIYNTIKQIN
ncbi:MAG: hypothetical protein V4546_02075 [Bacteroidota bacterium]|nr:hypothetical protein [Pedobacter cryotolerans]